MTNRLNEKRSYAVIIAAVISTLVLMVCGMVTGLVYSVREHGEYSADSGREMAGHLLTDAAYSLKNSMSALRLCNEAEPAEEINRTALVYAVRAETALECRGDDWTDNRSREAFLNDIATILHSYSALDTIDMSEKLYEYATKFYGSVAYGETFEYNGELISGGASDDDSYEVTDEEKSAAAELIGAALGAERTEYIGAWGGHMEFYAERNGKSGYALVCSDKIIEFSFTRSDESGDAADSEESITAANEVALDTAAACGYDGLTVKWSGVVGRSISVIMCKDYDGALAGDDCATAVVAGGEVVAFSAGKCDHEHKNIPAPKKTEREASKAARGGGEGTLVVRTVNGKERICYEYRYELDDGVHYVYVCAESGKQIQVK